MKKIKEKLNCIADNFIMVSCMFTVMYVITAIIGAVMGKRLEWISYK